MNRRDLRKRFLQQPPTETNGCDQILTFILVLIVIAAAILGFFDK